MAQTNKIAMSSDPTEKKNNLAVPSLIEFPGYN